LTNSIDNEVLSLLKKVELDNKKNSYPYQLSGGEKQRVAIARAIALKPDILCFDEPTSALDPKLVDGLIAVIRDLKNTLKMTMIIVTHDISFAKKISDKVLFINEGSVCECGYVNDLFENPQKEETKKFLKDYL
jgi:polar amino acid transport system ATP-binding protein